MKKLMCVLGVLLLVVGCTSYRSSVSKSLILITDKNTIKELITTRFNGNYSQLESDKSTVAGSSYSATNTQVNGVDEADIVKTNGTLIVHVNSNVIYIVDSVADRLAARIDYPLKENDTKYYYPSDIYLTDNKLIVLGSINSYPGGVYTYGGGVMKTDMFWIGYQDSFVQIYDLSDPKKPALLRSLEIKGGYYSSRLVDNELIVIANQQQLITVDAQQNENVVEPSVYDSLTKTTVSSIEDGTAFILPGKMGNSFVNIMKINIGSTAEPALTSFFGSIQSIYMDKENLLIAQYRYEEISSTQGKTLTDLLRFNIDTMKLEAQTSFEGYLLNQFSLDIYNQSIRVAATNWNANAKVSNSVYVYNMNLDLESSILGIAPGESIRAVRFIENKGYVVTFENIDPLFVLDLSNPFTAKIVGELKVPGFSTYIHPISKDTLFGIAEDVEVIQYTDVSGKVFNSMKHNGVKVSLFDVSDPTSPKEVQSINIIGPNGYSEGQYNHKAIVYDAENQLLYLPYSDYPMTSCEVKDGNCQYLHTSGIKIVKITGKEVQLVKTIEFSVDNQGSNYVSRSLFIGNSLYLVTNKGLVEYNRTTLEEVRRITYE